MATSFGQTGRASLPANATIPEKVSLISSHQTSSTDRNPDPYKLIYLTRFQGTLRKKSKDIVQASDAMDASFAKELKEAGRAGYRLNSVVISDAGYPLNIVPIGMATARDSDTNTTFLIQTEAGYYPEPRGESSTPNGR
jgi:hypothetical protein